MNCTERIGNSSITKKIDSTQNDLSNITVVLDDSSNSEKWDDRPTLYGNPEMYYLKYIEVYSDSLNDWKTGMTLPHFLSDTTLDLKFAFVGTDLHHPHSIRKHILDSTNNIEVLKNIISDGHATYLVRPCSYYNTEELDIPFCNYSWLDLVRIRLDSLK